MICISSVLLLVLFCVVTFFTFLGLNFVDLRSIKLSLPPTSAYTEDCAVGEDKAATLSPRLQLLFNVVTHHVPSTARYLLAYLTWIRPLGILFLLPIAFVVLLYFTAFMVQMYRLRKWLFSKSMLSKKSSSLCVLFLKPPFNSDLHWYIIN